MYSFIANARQKKSSSGPDGLPYEILNLIVTFEPFHSLIYCVYNDALDHGIFPATWDESLMSLLPKKGDLTQMKNYRPIPLVNTDTKIFARLVNSRIMRVSRKIVNENQLGFIPGRYIAENGMITQVIMEHAACQSSSDDKSLALLLDQEKAYDRINLHYLEQVMLTWGFPASIVNSIITMLANNRIKINVNGFISADVFKRRGLKQGDPISPILYNLALEPFLRSVLQDSTYSGYTMDLQPHLVTGGSTDTSVNVKILCYADDTLVFIKNLQDLSRLKHHIEVYSRSSNARINYNKVETISLSGRDHSSYWGRDLTDMNIPRIHLPTNPDPIVYLGFPLIQSSLQRRTFMSQFTNKIKQIALLHSTRSLSILGRATIVNSLILSMCWYLFRVTPITKADISKIRSVVSKFMNQGIFPRIKWTILTLPKHLGGLNLIDPHIQQAALYFRWIQPLLVTRQRSRPSKVTRLLRIHLKNTYNTQHHEIPLLFQDGRKSTQLRLFNICNLLTKSIDLIPRNFSTMELNPHACLLLPIQDIFMHPEQRFKFPSICGRMKVQDLFQYNPQTHTIARIPHADMDNRFKRAANKIYRGVEASKLFLSYFFASPM
ncbi:hypothetical protein G6F21_010864 [Rhizopus arrhizus]|nr:hypothetical protein G6F21_010864 [Rhizopus arrhizus]